MHCWRWSTANSSPCASPTRSAISPNGWTDASTTRMPGGRARNCGRRSRRGRSSTSRPARAPYPRSCASSCAPTRWRVRAAGGRHPGRLRLLRSARNDKKACHREERSDKAISRVWLGPLPVADKPQAGVAANLVDDLQDALAIGPVLHAELLHEPAVVDQVVAGNRLAAGLLPE